jgi:hypothetical protein
MSVADVVANSVIVASDADAEGKNRSSHFQKQREEGALVVETNRRKLLWKLEMTVTLY